MDKLLSSPDHSAAETHDFYIRYQDLKEQHNEEMNRWAQYTHEVEVFLKNNELTWKHLQFEKEYRIHVYETGPDERVNLCSLFNYMQDIASEHAVKLGFGRDDLMKKNHFWVLSRMYAVISDRPFWDETIIVKTWPNGTDNVFA